MFFFMKSEEPIKSIFFNTKYGKIVEIWLSWLIQF